MVTEYGERASYPVRKRNQHLGRLMTVLCVTLFVSGLLLGLALGSGNWHLIWGYVPLSALLYLLAGKMIDADGRVAERHQKGAVGERQIAAIFRSLSDDYHVFHGVEVEGNGDMDHIVVGPTGVFCIDAKNWRGPIKADEDGELVIDGKPQIRAATRRVMALREQLGLRQDELPWFQLVFAFVDKNEHVPKWRTTGKVHCVRDGKLLDYLQSPPEAKPLSAEQNGDIVAALSKRL